MASIRDGFDLTKKERKQLERKREAAWDRRIYRRLCALLWLNEGRTQEEVANLLGVADRTVRNWIKLYRKGGLDLLCQLGHRGRECDLDEEQLAQLKGEIEVGRFRSAKQVRRWIEENFGRDYSLSGVRDLLKRLGASFHKTSALMFKADPQKQKEFLKKIPTAKTDSEAAGAALLC
jgi:transposase